jgi:hypothetical protein
MKRQAISRYLFYLAFENSHERGYVTEKVFDALLAGVVPVYLGSALDCKPMLPHEKAAIFVDDFEGDVKKLADYLIYLQGNSTAYEEHRAWRRGGGWDIYDKTVGGNRTKCDYSLAELAERGIRLPSLLAVSWPCRVCQWAVQEMHSFRKRRSKKKNREIAGSLACRERRDLIKN